MPYTEVVFASPSWSPPESPRPAWDHQALEREIARNFETIRGAPQKVIRDSNSDLAHDPNNAPALFVRGLARHVLGVYGLGLRDLQRAIFLDGRLAPACHTWAIAGAPRRGPAPKPHLLQAAMTEKYPPSNRKREHTKRTT